MNKPYELVLVGCAQTKVNAATTAERLYTSPLFKASRRWAIAHGDHWGILSALHGVVWPDQVVEPYDVTLRGGDKHAIRAWAFRVQASVCHLAEKGKPARCAILAGKTYTEPLRNAGAIRGFDEPLAGMSIGKRLAWLRNSVSVEVAPTATTQLMLPIEAAPLVG